MAVRDLGYRPYEGERLPPSNNTKVLLRHGLSRAWGSWLVKIAAFTAWIPPVVALTIVGIVYWIGQNGPPGAEGPEIRAPEVLRSLFWWQMWLLVTLVTVGAGAAAIAEDLQFKAFQFYFSKPVTPPQYLLGRIGAVAFWVFLMTFPGAAIVVLVLVGTVPQELRLETAGLLLPTLFHSIVLSLVTACGSVGLSSLSKSRALTMSAWILLFLVPHALGAIVNAVSDWPWILLLSIPELLDVVGDALFKVQPDTDMRWYHAAPVLVGIVLGGVALASTRVRKAEVIT